MQKTLIYILLSLLAAGLLQASPELDRLNGAFKAKLDEETKTFKDSLKKAGIHYLVQLDGIENGLRGSGDLDGILVVQAEKQRMSGIPSVSKRNVVREPASLRDLQLKYINFSEGKARDFGMTLMQLMNAYRTKLGEMETWMTQNGRIEDALAVSKLRKGLGEGTDVLDHDLLIDIPEREKVAAGLVQVNYRNTLARFRNVIQVRAVGYPENRGSDTITFSVNNTVMSPDYRSSNGSVSYRVVRPDGSAGASESFYLSPTSSADRYNERVVETLNELEDGSIILFATRGQPQITRNLIDCLKQFGAKVGPKNTIEYAPYILIGVKGLAQGSGIEVQGQIRDNFLHFPSVRPAAANTDPFVNSAAAKGGLMKRPKRNSASPRF